MWTSFVCLAAIIASLLLTQGAFAQGSEDLNVWNVYCSGDGSRCTVAKEPTGDMTMPIFPGKTGAGRDPGSNSGGVRKKKLSILKSTSPESPHRQ